MSEYGIPYMGSKSSIAASIALNFPKAENFYDLFGGGFSMTHYMTVNKKSRYKHFHYNEINHDIVELVKDAIAGKYNYKTFKPAWISKEDFDLLKNNDPYIRICWSFGNNQKNYLFSKDIEPYKRSLHMAVIFDEFDDTARNVLGFNKWPEIVKTIKQKRIYLRQKVAFDSNGRSRGDLQQLEQLERLQQLEQLQQLERLDNLSLTSKDYRDVNIKENSIVYCDIPYRNTHGYLNKFNHEDFYEWAATRKFPVYISEYSLPDLRFKLIYSINKISLFNSDKSITKEKSENLYWNGVNLCH